MWGNYQYTIDQIISFYQNSECPVDNFLFGPVFSEEAFLPYTYEELCSVELTWERKKKVKQQVEEPAPPQLQPAIRTNQKQQVDQPTIPSDTDNDEEEDPIDDILDDGMPLFRAPGFARKVQPPEHPEMVFPESTFGEKPVEEQKEEGEKEEAFKMTPRVKTAIFAPVIKVREGFLPPEAPDVNIEEMKKEKDERGKANYMKMLEQIKAHEEAEAERKKKAKKVKKVKKVKPAKTAKPGKSSKKSNKEEEPQNNTAEIPVEKRVEQFINNAKKKMADQNNIEDEQPKVTIKAGKIIKMDHVPDLGAILDEEEKAAAEAKKEAELNAPKPKVEHIPRKLLPEDELVEEDVPEDDGKKKRKKRKVKVIISPRIKQGETEVFTEEDYENVVYGTIRKKESEIMLDAEKEFQENHRMYGQAPVPTMLQLKQRETEGKVHRIAISNIVTETPNNQHEITIEKPKRLVNLPREKIEPIPWMERELGKHLDQEDAIDIAQSVAIKSKDKMLQALSIVLFSDKKAKLITERFFHQFPARS
ncbi:hypothetical protein TVAG_192610 [Trichomonas vaginalis G3]|uniref:Uncharacterized protein n=1 Tax=Trichomonas vaginalis (strain ATCC PRA-98 / G3) TaxID=412133 RepID=A2DGX5_TRIV3|nr:hypothetical protein TVAGG3_0319050 [Trichomonas vaginalis G3]EAY20285.1 hypothetical protein TVAG_192610 [Trichomonas vaginalis G3]KAI5529157.1 hypothetical protein TVAGG3_0319050 [Trichomonas vaginalis G3]|eukprot:XP_001581271.1 hypothetical protein [Trichomonas vaginalis G3]